MKIKVFVYGTLKTFGALDLGRFLDGTKKLADGRVQGELRHNGIPYFLPHGAQLRHPVSQPWFTSHEPEFLKLLPHAEEAQPWVDDRSIPTVVGELWEIEEADLCRLDAVEGVRRFKDGSFSPQGSHYLPVYVTVLKDDGSTDSAIAYSFNVLNGADSWRSLRLIANGDY